MKKNPLIFGMIAAALALTIFSLTAADDARPPAPEQPWQHLAFETTPEKATGNPAVSQQIVKLGQEGWELVTVLNFNNQGTTTRTVYYFKKPQ